MASHDAHSRLGIADQMADAIASIRGRPLRALATSLGVLIGVAAAVSAMSLSDTARFQVSDTFDTLRATQVVVQAQPTADGPTPEVPKGSIDRIDQLSGVRRAGTFMELPVNAMSMTASPLPGANSFALPKVIGSDASYLKAASATIDGSGLSRFAVRNSAHVAVVGSRVMTALGLDETARRSRIYLDGVAFDVIGTITSAPGNPVLTSSVVVPLPVVGQLWRVDAVPQMLIRVVPGAAPSVAAAVPYAINPADPKQFQALDPPDPTTFKRTVDSDLAALGLGVAGIVALVGVVGIAAVTLAGVYERMEEFGLRRAIGARPSHLVRHVMTETTLIGLVSGTVGGVLGVAVVLIVSAVKHWIPVVSPEVLIVAPVAGLCAGILAGIVPARRASAIEPVEALRL